MGMRNVRMASLFQPLVVLGAVAGCAGSSGMPAPGVGPGAWVYPGISWDSIGDPGAAGWSAAGLDSVRAGLSQLASTGFVAVAGGRVLMTYGDPTEVSYLASVRKSVLSMLMGYYVRNGTVDLNATLARLGMDDIGGLTAQEKEATVKDLLTARSGVYHPASNEGDDLASAPPRGSQRHGTYYLYSNWDFNALGGAFERMTGKDIYDALESDLARPIGMQDFDRARHRKSGDSTRSRYLAYHMNFSTRDMARLGYLMLRRGHWQGRQVIPADWVDESTRAFTPVTEMNPVRRRSGPFGYGYLWWVWDGAAATGPYQGAYGGHGAIGQHIMVLPALDLVVAHKTRPGQRDAQGRARSVSHEQFLRVLDVLVRAHCGRRCPAGPARPEPVLLGEFEDDYGSRYRISATEWAQGTKARYHIARWYPAGQYAIARNDAANPGDGGLWTRIDWMPLPGMAPWIWGYCYSTYNAPSADSAARVRIADRAHPRTGCNGFPFSRMKRSGTSSQGVP